MRELMRKANIGLVMQLVIVAAMRQTQSLKRT